MIGPSLHPGEKSIALFPGQGVKPNREAAVRNRPDLIDALDDLLGYDAFDDLSGTSSAQPAIYCASLALWSECPNAEIHCFAGHSLGEITALAAAGWLDDIEGLRLVIQRGDLMEKACAFHSGGMIAILGTDAFSALPLAESRRLVLANENAPDQLVVAGDDEALQALAEDLSQREISFIRLPVAGAFHSPLMNSSVAPFREALAHAELKPNDRIVFSASTLAPLTCIDELADGIVRPVRWRQALLLLWETGGRFFTVLGPGRTLGGLVRRNLPNAHLQEIP